MRTLAQRLVLAALIAATTGAYASPQEKRVAVVADPTNKAAEFAASDISAAFTRKGFIVSRIAPSALANDRTPLQVVIAVSGDAIAGQPIVSGLTPQAYALRRVAAGPTTRWWAIGGDAPGSMYAGLELAEEIAINGSLDRTVERQVAPSITSRGIKFNIPLDARTPSYSDDSTSAQANIAEMWSMDFWTAMLDDMARHRFNMLSLWSLSPFPSLVKVPEYPNVALADVKRKTGALWDATNQGRNMYDASWTLETLKVMSIDEKIAFWRQVMQYAKDRGVDVSVFTWNIFVYGTEGSGYGITDSPANPVTRDYVRRSVRTLFNTYPLLANVGVTSGENMGNLDEGGKEQWMWESFGQGVADAIADARNPSSPFHAPNRKIGLIHRAHQADLSKIVTEFQKLPGYGDEDSTLSFSFKYSQAHMHSSTAPRFIYQNGWFDTIPAGKKTWLTVRNDDMYYLRAADPDFARAYWTLLPTRSKIAGFYMGPDGYTWGRDYVSRNPGSPRQTVIARQWYSFLVWGRLAFEPALPNSRFAAIVGARFPEVPGERLFTAWSEVSRILPLMTRLYWGSLDFHWYPEGSWSQAGYAGVQELITPKYPPMREDEDGQTPRIMSVKAFVDGEAPAGRLTPLDVATAIARHADAGMKQATGLSGGSNRELTETLGDIRAMAWLGRHYAAKIRGAVSLYRYQKTKETGAHEEARRELQLAADAWRQYAAIWSAQYLPQGLTRMGLTPVDMAATQTFVDRDIPAPLSR